MRVVTFEDCLHVLSAFNVDIKKGKVIEIGGSQAVSLKSRFSSISRVTKNPFLNYNPDIILLDKGFNEDHLNTKSDIRLDFLVKESLLEYKDQFDLVLSFDTLEHIPDPFLFCENLLYITKPGGFIYLATVFSYVFHPSPDDYFRFTPDGLKQCFIKSNFKEGTGFSILWAGWETSPEGVAILCYKGNSHDHQDKKAFDLPQPRNRNKFVSKVLNYLKYYIEKTEQKLITYDFDK